MTGLLTRKGKTYIFRDDHAHGDGIWAWDAHGDYDRAKIHKWEKLPSGQVELFDIDNPPPTARYQPLLD